MVCSICGQPGHNRRTCPQRNTTGLTNQPIPPSDPPPNRRALTRKFWRTTIKTIVNLQRFVKVSLNLHENKENLKYSYFHWLKNKDLYISFPCYPDSFGTFIVGILNLGYSHKLQILNATNTACSELYKARNPVKDNKKTIKLINMRNENYLIYWVLGNIMIEDIDRKENSINYMGILRKNDKFGLNTMIGHRFYLVPHRLDSEPPYHPQTDKQFFIEPHLQINIHENTKKEIYIDDGEKLSELNRWKFNALKLDYLIREMIKLGAKNNETLDIVLDLHEDITLDEVSEWYKDIAGIPSTFTNIT
ncbi:MAG: hypothetical protein CMK44_01015 [Porticoccus sp.]|nr:hypothetical protein [Porticoccus sp.]